MITTKQRITNKKAEIKEIQEDLINITDTEEKKRLKQEITSIESEVRLLELNKDKPNKTLAVGVMPEEEETQDNTEVILDGLYDLESNLEEQLEECYNKTTEYELEKVREDIRTFQKEMEIINNKSN